MKTFFQLSERAKKHARGKLLNEATPGQPATAAPTTAAPTAPATTQPQKPAAPAQQAQPDYKTFSTAWAEFIKDPNNAAVVQAMGQTQLGQLATAIQKAATAPPAATTAPAK